MCSYLCSAAQRATVLDYPPVPARLRRGQTGKQHQHLPILTKQLNPAAPQHCCKAPESPTQAQQRGKSRRVSRSQELLQQENHRSP